MTRAFAYARYSCDNQREESIVAQFRAIHAYAEKHGIEIVREYSDEAESAKTDDRPEFQRMFDDIPGSGIDTMLVHKQDRFSRSRQDSAIYKGVLARAGVRLILVDQPLDDSPESVIMEALLEGMAEYYSRNLARETMKGLKENAYQCKHTGGVPPLGYILAPDKTYLVEPSEAETVQRIFAMYAAGRGYDDILDTMRQQRTKTGGVFTKNSISAILWNEKYIGTFVFNRTARAARNSHKSKPDAEVIRIPGGVPRIVDNATWNIVQERLTDNRRNPAARARHVYLLSGKLICGKCGAVMVGTTSVSGQSKTEYSYYVCGTRDRSRTCDMPRIGADRVEGAVLDAIDERLRGVSVDAILEKVMEQMDEEPEDVRSARDELRTVQRQSASIISAIKDGAYHPAMKDELSALSEREAVLKERIASSRPISAPTREDVAAFLEKLQNIKKLSRDSQKAVIADLVDKIVVLGEDDLHIDFRIIRAPMGASPRNHLKNPSFRGFFLYFGLGFDCFCTRFYCYHLIFTPSCIQCAKHRVQFIADIGDKCVNRGLLFLLLMRIDLARHMWAGVTKRFLRYQYIYTHIFEQGGMQGL